MEKLHSEFTGNVPNGWNNTSNTQSERRTYTVEEIARLLSISRSAAYELVKQGNFRVVKIGTAIRISKRSFDDWLDQNND